MFCFFDRLSNPALVLFAEAVVFAFFDFQFLIQKLPQFFRVLVVKILDIFLAGDADHKIRI